MKTFDIIICGLTGAIATACLQWWVFEQFGELAGLSTWAIFCLVYSVIAFRAEARR